MVEAVALSIEQGSSSKPVVAWLPETGESVKMEFCGVAYTGILIHSTIKRPGSKSLTATWVPMEMEANRAQAKVPGTTVSSWEQMLPAEPDTFKNILWNQTKSNSNHDGHRSESQGLLLFFLDCANHKVWNNPRDRAGPVKKEWY